MSRRKLGKYELIERLGRGGMAEVYRAYHASLDRYVAIKILHTYLSDSPEFKSRFEKEAQSIARLKHPHIVQVYDFDYSAADDSYYMVMELIEGPTLKERLSQLGARSARFPFGEVVRIMVEASSALAYAHRHHMIHRDVKPANLMLDHDKRVVLTDFGIAKILSGQQFTTTGGMVGTPAYMAPEQGMGDSGDERSDLYSLGVIMYEMLTGKLPYEAETPVAMILKHVNTPIPSACDANPSLPRSVDYILALLLAKNPNDRYQKVAALIDDLKRLQAGEPVGEELPAEKTRPMPPGYPARKPLSPAAQLVDDNDTVLLPPAIPSSQAASISRRGRLPWWVWAGSVTAIVALGMAGILINSNRGVAGVAFVSTETATATITASPAKQSSFTPTARPSDESRAIPLPSQTPSATPTPTVTLTPTPTVAMSPPLATASAETPALTATLPPSPNATETLAYIKTATTAACRLDYAIIVHDPPDGERGGFFPVNSAYERRITFLNTGNCAWEPNTSLTFVEGEDFDAGPRIFIRQAVEPAAEVTVLFKGTLPQKGSLTPLVGTWELRTPGQIRIGQPFTISILVYDPGS